MKRKNHISIAKLIFVFIIIFFTIACAGIYLGSRFINHQFLMANENMAVDIAQLVKNNFRITDEEVKYMKSLTFNEMEVDAINMRLMDVGNGVKLNTDVINVYIVAPLSNEEIKYTTDKETAKFFGYDEGTKLNGIWLLNGIIDKNGKFVATQREDIYRYTKLTKKQEKAIISQTAFGDYSKDAWGNFITGYAPVFTVEGNFVGMLGIDMSPDRFQKSAKNMILILLCSFVMISVTMIILFLIFYFKYIKAKEGQLYFDFYSRMSHDMRTPMNGILGMAALSKNENDINELHRNFKLVEESGNYMLGLINDTLDIQKLEAGKLKLDPKIRNCNMLIASLAAMVKQEADKKQVNFVVINKDDNPEHYSLVDELRIQQIFMNIASNAIKFTPAGGTVTFTIEPQSIDKNICHHKFQISDTGIGMSEKFINEHLFKPFEQEQNSVTTQYGGSGLGLSIVKSLVDLMGGRIEVESKPGKGTTFTVYLDIEIVEKEKAEQVIEHSKSTENIQFDTLDGIHILLCEDHSLNAEIAKKLLEKKGCHITMARNGKEGVDLFRESLEGTYDVILMDIRMPIMDGLTAAKEIRKLIRKDAKLVPIIAMTANAYDDDVKLCLEAGMNDHIAKPINPELMYKKIAKVIMK